MNLQTILSAKTNSERQNSNKERSVEKLVSTGIVSKPILNEDLGNALVSCCFITGGNKILGFILEDIKMVEFQLAIKNGYTNSWQGRQIKMSLWRI
jgi:hypothetical protein